MKNSCLLIFTDGRDYLKDTLDSFSKNLEWDFDHVIITNDSGDIDQSWGLIGKFKQYRGVTIQHRVNVERIGFAKTIASAWKEIPADVEWIFHLEDDFILKHKLNLSKMIDVMSINQHLIQLAIMRQPWNEDEKRCGGIWQWHSSRGVEFTQKSMRYQQNDDASFYMLNWYEHCGWFTTNPCLYPRWVADHGWPVDEGAGEGKLMRELLALDPRRRAAYWGVMGQEPIVEHIGFGRKGIGY